jgi:hypothetical protein
MNQPDYITGHAEHKPALALGDEQITAWRYMF